MRFRYSVNINVGPAKLFEHSVYSCSISGTGFSAMLSSPKRLTRWLRIYGDVGDFRFQTAGAAIHAKPLKGNEDTFPGNEGHVCIRPGRQFVCRARHPRLRWSNAPFPWTMLDSVLERLRGTLCMTLKMWYKAGPENASYSNIFCSLFISIDVCLIIKAPTVWYSSPSMSAGSLPVTHRWIVLCRYTDQFLESPMEATQGPSSHYLGLS
jgi:hypothetical protein